MHGLLDSVIESVSQDDGVEEANIEPNVAYSLFNESGQLGHGLRVSVEGIKIKTIRIEIGASERIQPSIPALKIDVHTEGEMKVKFGNVSLATVKIRGDHLHFESGLILDANGTFSAKTWIEEEDILDADLDLSWEAMLSLAGPAVLALGAAGLVEYIESEINDKIRRGFSSVLTGVMTQVPRVIAVILGGAFTFRSLRLAGNDILFEYIAPLESEPKQSEKYIGIIGRSAMQLGPGTWHITPRTLGDTWDVQNLHKIDHIVVVMMENRSFDHVLGYRAQLPNVQGCDGLTTDLTSFLESEGFPIRKLNQSGITPNELDLRTRFPAHVGHALEDVTQQLSVRITSTSGRIINSPKGFVDNFAQTAARYEDLTKEDVLGFYEGNDLPFFKFLAENYSYCEKYYCSHAGPTLPNRMFSLTGDLQYDRTGEAILDNNNRDNFSLSRATTIYDLLTRKRVGWRVYESFPSVTMLRMFARYATDNTNIVPFFRFQQDVVQGVLPALAIVEPAMHHAPPNDDHPDADMYRGQLFLKNVYDTLRSNEALWLKTMLVITYDEHGGFYDHAVPPMAEVRTRPMVVQVPGGSGAGGGHFTPSTLATHYGLRVPTFVVSPWSPVGKGPDLVLDHCSILKTIMARFCSESKPFLSDRVNASQSFNAYLSEAQPRMDVPVSPTMRPLPFAQASGERSIETEPISRKQMRSGNVDYHVLTGMLARMLGR